MICLHEETKTKFEQSVVALIGSLSTVPKHVRIKAGLPVSNSDRLWEVTPLINHVNLRTYRTDHR